MIAESIQNDLYAALLNGFNALIKSPQHCTMFLHLAGIDLIRWILKAQTRHLSRVLTKCCQENNKDQAFYDAFMAKYDSVIVEKSGESGQLTIEIFKNKVLGFLWSLEKDTNLSSNDRYLIAELVSIMTTFAMKSSELKDSLDFLIALEDKRNNL